MDRLTSKVLLLVLVCGSLAGLAFAQGSSMGSVRGTCKDAQGAPIIGQMVWKNQDDGRTYNIKTDKKGSYYSLGIEPGNYVVTLSKDGQVMDEQKNVHVSTEELVYDVDLKKIQEQGVADTAKKSGITAEQVKQQTEQQQASVEKTKQYNENVKLVNDKWKVGDELMKATPPNYPQAIAAYQEAANLLPTNDQVWYKVGAAYMDSARAQTDAAEKKKQNTEAYADLQKAIDLKKADKPASDAAKAEKATRDLAAYYDNLGAVAARLGKADEAMADYQQAVQLDPAGAAKYYFNEGITLYNTAMDDATRKKAIEAFDKTLVADPNKAEAYYLKGATLFAMMTQKPDGTPVPAPGTIEALNKYLELQPTGGYAEQAKGMLVALNQKIETGYGTAKKKK